MTNTNDEAVMAEYFDILDEIKHAKSLDSSGIRIAQNTCCRAADEIIKLREQVKYLNRGSLTGNYLKIKEKR